MALPNIKKALSVAAAPALALSLALSPASTAMAQDANYQQTASADVAGECRAV